MSPLGTKLTQSEISEFLNHKQDFDFLVQFNFVLTMLNKKLRDSQHFIDQIDDLAELYFISTLNNYF